MGDNLGFFGVSSFWYGLTVFAAFFVVGHNIT